MFTPSWWFPNWNQYGTLKMIVVNKKGTFIDGIKISDVSSSRLSIGPQDDITFRLQTQEPAVNVGGITLFGKEFGNYNQDIRVRVNYSPG